jgi:hypothetical protein
MIVIPFTFHGIISLNICSDLGFVPVLILPSQGGATQMRFQPCKGKYLAAASEKTIYILDGETQHACRNPLQVGCQGSLLKSVEDAFRSRYGLHAPLAFLWDQELVY